MATACALDRRTNWIMLSLTIERATGRGPSVRLLAEIVTAYSEGA